MRKDQVESKFEVGDQEGIRIRVELEGQKELKFRWMRIRLMRIRLMRIRLMRIRNQ